MEKKHYVVITDGPGSLLEPPTGTPLVYFDERAGEEDGRSWVIADGTRYHKQRWALKAAMKGTS